MKVKKLLKNRNALILTGGIVALVIICVIGFWHSERYRLAKWECRQITQMANQRMPKEWGQLNCSCYAECVDELSGGRKFMPVNTDFCIETCYEFNRNFL